MSFGSILAQGRFFCQSVDLLICISISIYLFILMFNVMLVIVVPPFIQSIGILLDAEHITSVEYVHNIFTLVFYNK